MTIDHFSPAREEEWPKAINVHISFEEAMRPYLGLSEVLSQLNKHNRATTAGRRSAVNLCSYPLKRRITINEGRTAE